MTFLFYIFAALTLVGGIGVVVYKNPVSSAFAMILSFLGLAALFIQLEPERVTDAFAPGAVWLHVDAPVQVASSPRISSSEFMRRHGLQAIMVADGRDCAIVSSRLLHIGDELDGWVLWMIGKRVVTFRGGEDELALVLDRDE